jgi:RNA polymerase sigma-70 factor (ECF subfamily)
LSSVAAWVNTIALNLLRGDARKAVPQVEIDDRDEPVRSSIDSKVDAEKALSALSEEDRRLMLLHVVAGLTSKEIATDSKLSPVAIRVRLHRAKAQLRKRFSADGGKRRNRRSSRRRCVSVN